MVEIVFPQRDHVKGGLPFNAIFDDKEMYPHPKGAPEGESNRVMVWMVSTKIPLLGVIYKEDMPLYPFYWDGPETPEWIPRFEFLVETRKHGAIHRRWGTQPLNTYLRGHFCLKPMQGYGWVRAGAVGEFVLVQQYFKSGWWGNGSRIVIAEQIEQNKVGIPLLRQLGVLKQDTNVYFMDQSKPEGEIRFGHDPFRLFRANGLLEAYHKWLPKYLREWRSGDFGMPIDEVIDRYVKPNV